MLTPEEEKEKARMIEVIEDIDVRKALHATYILQMSPPTYYRKIKKYGIEFRSIKMRVKKDHKKIFSERILTVLSSDPDMKKESVSKSFCMSSSKLVSLMQYYGINFWDLRREAKARIFELKVIGLLEKDHNLSIKEVAKYLRTTVNGVQWRLSAGGRNFRAIKRGILFEKVRCLALKGEYKKKSDMALALGVCDDTLTSLLKSLGINQKDIEQARQQYSENFEDFHVDTHPVVSKEEKAKLSQLMTDRPNRTMYMYAMNLNMTCDRVSLILSEMSEPVEA